MNIDLLTFAIIHLCVMIGLVLWEYLAFSSRRVTYATALDRSEQAKGRFFSHIPLLLPRRLRGFVDGFTAWVKSRKSHMNPSSIVVSIPHVIILNAGLGLIAYNISQLADIPIAMILGAGFIIQLILYTYLSRKKIQKREALEARLPEILEIMARVYRVHTDLRVALHEVAEHTPDPIVAGLFREMVQLSRFGYTVEEAMEYVARDIGSKDFRFVVASVRLNVPVGGDVSQLFDYTAEMLRKRKEAKTEIGNVMFQSRISAMLSAFLVPIITVVAFMSSERYQEVLLFNPNGRLVLIGCFLWWLIGVVIIHKNSRIRI